MMQCDIIYKTKHSYGGLLNEIKKMIALSMATSLAFSNLTVYNSFANGVIVNESLSGFQLVRAEFIAEYPDDIELIDEVIKIAMCDSTFIETFEYDSELAMEILKNTLSG